MQASGGIASGPRLRKQQARPRTLISERGQGGEHNEDDEKAPAERLLACSIGLNAGGLDAATNVLLYPRGHVPLHVPPNVAFPRPGRQDIGIVSFVVGQSSECDSHLLSPYITNLENTHRDTSLLLLKRYDKRQSRAYRAPPTKVTPPLSLDRLQIAAQVGTCTVPRLAHDHHSSFSH